jgi:hypothetical protein
MCLCLRVQPCKGSEDKDKDSQCQATLTQITDGALYPVRFITY